MKYYSQKQHELLKKVLDFIDQEVMQKKQTRSYEDLARHLGTANSNIFVSVALAKITEMDLALGIPPRTAGVVSKVTKRPADQFFTLVETLTGVEIADPETYWLSLVQKLGLLTQS